MKDIVVEEVKSLIQNESYWIFKTPKGILIFPASPHLNGVHWQDLNPEVDKPGKRKKLDATARAGSEDKDAGT